MPIPESFEAVYKLFLSNMVNIPFLKPIINALLQVPVINVIVALIFWRPIFAVLVTPGLLALTIALIYIIWFERKAAARVQWRFGPLEVSRRVGGLIQPIADLFRYLFQEIIIHREAHADYFIVFPVLALILAVLAAVTIPISPPGVPVIPEGTTTGIWGIFSEYGVIVVLAILTLLTVCILGLGWASHSRFAYVGVVREAFMYVACEIPLIISVLAMIVLYGTANPLEISLKQKIPGALLNPLAFLTFMIAAVMSTARIPFDIPEAEQEIALGPYVEYSGLLFGIAMTISYDKMYVLALLSTLLFLCSFWGPQIPYFGDLSYAIWMGIKTIVVMMIFVFLRSVYPRYRVDQAIRIGWKYLLPMSIVSLLISIGWRLSGLI